jgi:hypothetical protein
MGLIHFFIIRGGENTHPYTRPPESELSGSVTLAFRAHWSVPEEQGKYKSAIYGRRIPPRAYVEQLGAD